MAVAVAVGDIDASPTATAAAPAEDFILVLCLAVIFALSSATTDLVNADLTTSVLRSPLPLPGAGAGEWAGKCGETAGEMGGVRWPLLALPPGLHGAVVATAAASDAGDVGAWPTDADADDDADGGGGGGPL